METIQIMETTGSGECPHNKIQVIRQKRGYLWSCALCGNEMTRWDDIVWSKLGLDELQEGEGFVYNVVMGDQDEFHAEYH